MIAILAAAPYIEALYPIQQFMAEAESVAHGTIEKVDPKARVCVVKIGKSIKGKCPVKVVRLNVGAGKEWHPEAVAKHVVEGAPVVFFLAGDRAQLYLNRFFMQIQRGEGEDAMWSFIHVEIKLNRTFCGPAEELAKLVGDIHAGKVKAPPPDAKRTAITKEHLETLPIWGTKDVDEAKLPPSFSRSN